MITGHLPHNLITVLILLAHFLTELFGFLVFWYVWVLITYTFYILIFCLL